MSSTETNKKHIGLDYLTDIYTDSEIETENPQPLYILYKDTIKTFLYEKLDDLKKGGLVWGYIGAEITIIATLLTTEPSGVWIISGKTIKGVFLALALLLGFLIWLSRNHISWPKSEATMEDLVCELGRRGTIIKPSKKGKPKEPDILVNSDQSTLG